MGCGFGRICFYCEENLSVKCTGVDIEENAIEYAKHAAKVKGSNNEFLVQNYFELEFEKASFDHVIFVHNSIVECSYDEFELLCSEVKKVLKPGGKFIIPFSIMNNVNNYINQTGSYYVKQNITDRETQEITECQFSTYFYVPGFINYILAKFFDEIRSSTTEYTNVEGLHRKLINFIAVC